MNSTAVVPKIVIHTPSSSSHTTGCPSSSQQRVDTLQPMVNNEVQREKIGEGKAFSRKVAMLAGSLASGAYFASASYLQNTVNSEPINKTRLVMVGTVAAASYAAFMGLARLNSTEALSMKTLKLITAAFLIPFICNMGLPFSTYYAISAALFAFVFAARWS